MPLNDVLLAPAYAHVTLTTSLRHDVNSLSILLKLMDSATGRQNRGQTPCLPEHMMPSKCIKTRIHYLRRQSFSRSVPLVVLAYGDSVLDAKLPTTCWRLFRKISLLFITYSVS